MGIKYRFHNITLYRLTVNVAVQNTLRISSRQFWLSNRRIIRTFDTLSISGCSYIIGRPNWIKGNNSINGGNSSRQMNDAKPALPVLILFCNIFCLETDLRVVRWLHFAARGPIRSDNYELMQCSDPFPGKISFYPEGFGTRKTLSTEEPNYYPIARSYYNKTIISKSVVRRRRDDDRLETKMAKSKEF